LNGLQLKSHGQAIEKNLMEKGKKWYFLTEKE